MPQAAHPRELLEQLRDLLSDLTLFPNDAAERGADAISRFLDGKVPTLDHAFGLVASASRPSETERRYALAVKAYWLKGGLKGRLQSWEQIATKFYLDGESITGEKEIRELVTKEFKSRLLSERLNRRLDGEADKPGDKP